MKEHDIFPLKKYEIIEFNSENLPIKEGQIIGFVVEGIGELKELWYEIIPTVTPEIIMTKNWLALMPKGSKQRILFINAIDEVPQIVLNKRKMRLVKLKKEQR